MTTGFARIGMGVLLTMWAFLPVGGAESGADLPKAMTPDQVMTQAMDNPPASGTLEDVLGACERQASRFGRLTVIVDWAELKSAGVARDTRVTIEGKAPTVQQYLDRALRSATAQSGRLGWYRVETTVFVTTDEYITRNVGRIATLSLSPAPGGGGARAAASDSPAPDSPKRKTSSGVTFDDAPLDTVFDYVREISDVGLHVNWKALEAAGVTKATTVSIQVKNLSGSRILDLTVDQLTTGEDKLRKVYWYIEDGIVMVTTGQALNDTPLTSKVFQIGSMLVDAPNFVGPRIDISKLGQGSGQNGQGSGSNSLFGGDKAGGNSDTTSDTPNGDDRAARRKEVQDQIVALIKGTTSADMWEPEGKGKVVLMRDRVVVSQTRLGWLLMSK